MLAMYLYRAFRNYYQMKVRYYPYTTQTNESLELQQLEYRVYFQLQCNDLQKESRERERERKREKLLSHYVCFVYTM